MHSFYFHFGVDSASVKVSIIPSFNGLFIEFIFRTQKYGLIVTVSSNYMNNGRKIYQKIA